jgi:hypothetical protein
MLPSFNPSWHPLAADLRFLLSASPGTNWFWMFYASGPVGPGQRAPNHRAPVFLGAIQSFTAPQLYPVWSARFGPGAIGTQIIMDLYNRDVISGRSLGPFRTLTSAT